MFMLSQRAASALSLGTLFVLASCGGGGGASAPGPLPVSPQSAATVAGSTHETSSVTNVTNAPSAATNCTVLPVKSIQATLTEVTVTLAKSTTATFEVCTQYFSKYTATVADPTIASITITPSTVANNSVYFATVTVTGLKAGSTCVTITDKKGNSVRVSIRVLAPITFSPPSPLNLGVVGTQTITLSEAGYTGGFAIKSCSSPGNGLCESDVNGNPDLWECITAGGSSNEFLVGPVAGTPTTQFSAVLQFGGQPIPTNCTFTFGDQRGQTATYTITGQ